MSSSGEAGVNTVFTFNLEVNRLPPALLSKGMSEVKLPTCNTIAKSCTAVPNTSSPKQRRSIVVCGNRRDIVFKKKVSIHLFAFGFGSCAFKKKIQSKRKKNELNKKNCLNDNLQLQVLVTQYLEFFQFLKMFSKQTHYLNLKILDLCL